MSHTKEPWKVGYNLNSKNCIFDKAGNAIATMVYNFSHDQDTLANARRIVACVNACAGMVDPAAQRDELVGALKNLVFTASELWDDAQPIKPSDAFNLEHPIIEAARAVIQKLEADK